MTCHRRPHRILFYALLVTSSGLAMSAQARGVDFERDVKPLFQEHCLDCHGPEKQRGALRLDARALAFKGGDELGPAILPGKSHESPLFRLVSGVDADAKMPPKGPGLTPAEVAVLKQWIDEGAIWPEDGVGVNDAADKHWAYQPVKARRPPEIAKTGGAMVRTPVDAFVVAKLHAAGLEQAPEADRRTLIRRASFDIIGLPPTPEEVARFVKDPDPLAYEKLVDRLLDSPRYGERWARHWLDVVRFAESDGYEKNTPRTNAWPYRDYVIKAFNDDKPYDQFIREQLAGDALGEDAATGFIVGGPNDTVRSPDPVLTAQQRADDLNDMAATTGSAFLGLTIGCARCHTHKFDPVTHTDYHALVAMFAGVRHGSRPVRPPDHDVRLAKAQALQRELEPVLTSLAQFEPIAHNLATVVIPPDDETRVAKLKPSNARRTKYESGPAKGEAGFPGNARQSPTLADGYWVWLRENAAGDVLAWHPQVQGRYRIWVSWGSGYKSHDADARYLLDADGDPSTTADQKEIAIADHRKFADGTGTMPNRKLWSGFKDIGSHELTPSTRLILRAGGAEGFPTADVLVLQEEPASAPPPAPGPRLRLPVQRAANIERFAEVEARHVRFSIEETTQLEPCLDELEILTAGPQPRNAALASAGARLTASGTLPGHSSHQLRHLNDGKYGNEHSWISDKKGQGWVQVELAAPTRIDRVVWSRDRDNVPRYNDRLPVKYHIEVSLDGKTWTRVAGHQDRLPHTMKLAVTALPASHGLPAREVAKYETLHAERERLESAVVQETTFPTVYAGTFGQPGEIRRYQRGDVTQPQEEVPPGVVAALNPIPSLSTNTPDQERRLALARWIADPNHPLTARVAANRLWHYHFGTGIVDTPSDLGINGSRPTHPELLDWLAQELVSQNWSLKHLHRVILKSATYRQASAAPPGAPAAVTAQFAQAQQQDAQTRLLWRFPPRRLEAEVLRDSILAVTGKLDLWMGGPGFDLFEPNTNYVKVYQSKTTFVEEDFRRMVYQHKPRVELDDVFGAFDCPDAGQISPRRNVSTTPLQALSLLNSSFALQQAGFFAARLEKESGPDPQARVTHAFHLAYNRAPSPEEMAAGSALVREHGLPALCRALINTNEFLQIF